MEIGSQIRRHRTEHGLSQDDLATKIYVSRQTISSWENDKTYPDVESLLLLSVLFDVTVDELIKGDMEAMKEAIENDYRKMIYLAWGGTAVVIVGCALFIGGFTYWDWGLVPSTIIGLLVWGIGLGMLTVVEHLKKQHDVVTYRELVAFSKGEPIDRENPTSHRARRHPVLKAVIGTLAAAAVGAALGYFGYQFFG